MRKSIRDVAKEHNIDLSRVRDQGDVLDVLTGKRSHQEGQSMTRYTVTNRSGDQCEISTADFPRVLNSDDACRVACQLNLIPCHHWQDLTAEGQA